MIDNKEFEKLLTTPFDSGNYRSNRVLDVMIKAAIEAKKAILEVYARDFDVILKADSSPVTEADYASNDIITKALAGNFADVPILSEESADDKRRLCNRFCFIVDPLDGTKEFVKKNGEFTINIALADNGESVMGVVFCPTTDELYFAAKGMGSYRIKNGQCERIHTSSRTDGLIVMQSRSNATNECDALYKNAGKKIAEIRSVGSAMKGCRIAEGEGDIYYRYGRTMEWDTAAVQIVCEEAGGIFGQLDKNFSPMRYNRENNVNENGFFIINRAENRLH